MMAADALPFCAFIASFVLFSLTLRPQCRQALWAWWGAEPPLAPLPDGCINFGTLMLLSVAAWGAAQKALASWDWWRWTKRRA
jgi:hypothetical protein